MDEELPDYIMVMVANKKSQFQMSEDLGLFLGTNTEKFTTWLHGLLQKLQSITSDAAVAVPSKEKLSEKPKSKEQSTTIEDSSKSKKYVADEVKSKKLATDDVSEVKKDSKRRRSDQEKNSLVDASAKSDLTLSSGSGKKDSDSDHAVVIITETPEASLNQTAAPADVSNVKPLETKEVTKDAKILDTLETKDYNEAGLDSDIQVVEDDDLSELLLTENDELTEELEQETAIVLPASKKKEPMKATVIRISDDEVSSEPPRGAASIIMSKTSHRDTSPPQLSRPKAVTSPIRQAVHRTAYVRAVEPRPFELQTRKRRGPVSVIGSITHDSDDDDGYDPRNPAVGSVASVVRVTARKSSVPPKLQANK